ncbi:inositol monophosphatase family protein [Desulfobulbus oligotrophicus]|uniref:Inositol-1-monophosphatase n=1 Tax=Desulfobulbus oligotrophicus TaxID=1909699 RepID=A0A7T5VEX4_9BACT|nr:inositol monophosphatase family protein [Desulfobulbus oligotrophicus]QQG66660.1 inositol monophosphatase [Desulfobulbus oligotrophicus]
MNRIDNLLSQCTHTRQKSLLTSACKAALTAGKFICGNLNKPHDITMKGAIDLVTETDISAEQIIVQILKQDFPDIAVMTEEQTESHLLATKQLWIVDPLDGTTNFAHGFPYFAVSIAFLNEDIPEIAVIYAPFQDELFSAVKGSGAWLNDRAIHVTKTQQLIEALIGTGFPYDIKNCLPEVIQQLQSLLPNVRDIRRAGAAALDLAYVACGRLDGFYEAHLQPWDTAAGWLLIEEAGGMVSTFTGDAYSPFYPETLASNGELHPQLLKHLQWPIPHL